jgi:hypothetical protein
VVAIELLTTIWPACTTARAVPIARQRCGAKASNLCRVWPTGPSVDPLDREGGPSAMPPLAIDRLQSIPHPGRIFGQIVISATDCLQLQLWFEQFIRSGGVRAFFNDHFGFSAYSMDEIAELFSFATPESLAEAASSLDRAFALGLRLRWSYYALAMIPSC